MTTPTTHGQVPAIQRYKIGYHADEWGQRSSTPSGIPDASGSWVRYADHVAALAAPAQSGLPDAYVGAREDLSIWKRRALEAERDLRSEKQTTSRLVGELNAASGPTFMGDPASDKCHHGDTHIVHDCLRCGAPVCCGKCCAPEATPSRMAAQQGAAYAELPEPDATTVGLGAVWNRHSMRDFADRTHALRAPHGQASSQAGEYPALVCDYCGALTPDPWHSSGMLHGKMSKHIHSCDACAARGAAQAQDTREPLKDEQIQDLLLCGNPTDEEMRLIRIGWDAANGIKGGQHGTDN